MIMIDSLFYDGRNLKKLWQKLTVLEKVQSIEHCSEPKFRKKLTELHLNSDGETRTSCPSYPPLSPNCRNN